MSKDTAIYSLLTSFSSITNLIGDRVFPINRSQSSEVPALTYRKVSSPRDYDNDGITVEDDMYDINIYAGKYSTLQSLVELLESNLSGASGTFGTKKVEYVEVETLGNDDFLEDEEIYTDTIEIKIRFKDS